MRVEHGTYTDAQAATSGDTWPEASKVYTNDVDDVDVTFTLRDNTQVTVHVYRGTLIPLVTKSASWTGGKALILLR